MISSLPSEPRHDKPRDERDHDLGGDSRRKGDDDPHCESPKEHKETFWALRPAHPAPVLSQSLFGLSFVLFLALNDRMPSLTSQPRLVLLTWSFVQILLGAWVVWGRSRTKKRIWRCIRCHPALR